MKYFSFLLMKQEMFYCWRRVLMKLLMLSVDSKSLQSGIIPNFDIRNILYRHWFLSVNVQSDLDVVLFRNGNIAFR